MFSLWRYAAQYALDNEMFVAENSKCNCKIGKLMAQALKKHTTYLAFIRLQVKTTHCTSRIPGKGIYHKIF